MRAIFLNAKEMSLDPSTQTLGIKFAYWLATRIGITFVDKCMLLYREFIKQTSSRQSLPDKVKFILDGVDNEKEQQSLIDTLHAYRRLQKVKHRTGDVLVAGMRLENTVNKVFNAACERQIAAVEKEVASGMSELMKSDFDEYSGGPDGKKQDYSPLIDTLKMKPDGTDHFPMPGVFFLPVEYFTTPDDATVTWVSPDDAAAADPGKTWFYAAFDFVTYKDFPAASMQAIREHTAPERDAFCAAMGQWITNVTAPDTVFDDILFFNQEVRPRADALNQAIKGHVLMKPYANEPDIFPRFMIGSMPVAEIWRFYQERKLVPDSARQTLTEALQDPTYQRRWPVFVLHIPTNKASLPTPDETTPHRKKFISLD